MYAILDIETTGGQYNEEGITEIAIYKFDGQDIVDQFISLVNPEKPIQPFVVKLTGINEKMLEFAPKFHEVAKRIVEITTDCVLVAHNALFDYRILKNEFSRLGYDFKSKTICTVELAQNLIPNQTSYSLGKLVRSLGIPMADRHRASGDAIATVKLFQLLLEKDLSKEIVKQFIKQDVEKKANVRLLEILKPIPPRTGVFYLHNTNGEIILIGKARNMKKKINHYFVGTNSKSKKIQKDTAAISFEETGTDLIANIKEKQELSHIKPIYNNFLSLKKEFAFALYSQVNSLGYLQLQIKKTDKRKKEILLFNTLTEANYVLKLITEKYQLCPKINGYFETQNACYSHTTNKCFGACIQKEPPKEYNQRVVDCIAANKLQNANCIIVDRGRKVDEKSAVLIENNVVLGYCFYNLNYQITTLSILKNLLIPLEYNPDNTKTVNYYIQKSRSAKIIQF